MKDSTFVFTLTALALIAWISTGFWSRKRNRRLSLPLRTSLQTAFQVSLVLGIFLASIESFSARSETQPLIDFVPLFVGGKLMLSNPGGLYDPQEQLREERESTRLPLKQDDLLPFPYPPFVAVALSLPASLEFNLAFRVLLVISFGSLLAAVYLLVSSLNLERRKSQVLSLLITAFFPVYLTLAQGQLSLIFGLFLTLFWLRLYRGQPLRSFLWLALLTGKPSLTPVPLMTLFSRRLWRPLLLAVACSLCFWGFPLLWTGTGVMADWFELAGELSSGAYPSVSPAGMCGLRSLDIWIGAGNLLWIAGTVTILVALGMTRVWPLGGWGCVASILAVLLLAPHLYLHDLVLLLPAFALVLNELPVLKSSAFYLLFLLSMTPILTLSLGGSIGLPQAWLVLPLGGSWLYAVMRWRKSADAA